MMESNHVYMPVTMKMPDSIEQVKANIKSALNNKAQAEYGFSKAVGRGILGGM